MHVPNILHQSSGVKCGVASVRLRIPRAIVRLFSVEPLEALNALVARALDRTGARSEPALFRGLMLSEGYLYKWREMMREGRDGPTLRTLLPLLEAAGVFSSGLDEVAALEAEIGRLEALTRELAAQKKPQRRRRAAT